MEKRNLKDPSVDVVIKTERIGKKNYYIAQAVEVDIVAQGLSVNEALKNLKEIIKDRIKEEPSIKNSLIEEEQTCPMFTRIFL